MPLHFVAFILKCRMISPIRPTPEYSHFDTMLSEHELNLKARVRSFVREKILPLVADCYEKGVFPHEIVDASAEAGLFEHHGPVEAGLIAFELERADAGVRSMVSVHTHLAQSAIRFFGSPAQQATYLPRMERGEIIGAFSLTEPGHGSDPSGLETTAKRTASGYVLNGHKKWATNATFAGVTVIWARLVDDEVSPDDRDGAGAIRAFLVDAGTPGYRPVPIHRKLSFRMSASSEIFLENCEVPETHRLPGARGLGHALKCLNEARYGIVWGVAGAAEACFEEALAYGSSRIQFGRPIAGFQITQSKLATMYVSVVRSKLLALHLARLKERGVLHHTDVSLGKLNNVRDALDVARTARTILGGVGILDTTVSLRHAANLESELTYEGTDEVHALIIGRHLTGLDAFRG